MKISFKSLFNVLRFGGAYTVAALTCLAMSLCFYCVTYSNKNIKDVTFYACISALSLVCCIVHLLIIASSYTLRIIEDVTKKDDIKNDKTVNLFTFLHKICRIFTLIGCTGVIVIAVYMIVYTLLGVIS